MPSVSGYAQIVGNNVAIGDVAWADTSNAQGAADSDYAVAAGIRDAINLYSQYLVARDFALTIPDLVTIDGIEFDVTHEYEPGFPAVKDNSVVLYIGSTPKTYNNASGSNWGSSPADTVTYGSPSDLWGEGTIDQADIDATFGVAISAKGTDNGSDSNAWVYAVECTVHFTPNTRAGTGNPTTNGQSCSGAGTTDQLFTGTGAITTNGQSCAGEGATQCYGDGTITTNGQSCAGAGMYYPYVTGSGEAVTNGQSCAGAGQFPFTGEGAATTNGQSCSGAGTHVPNMFGAGSVTASGQACAGAGLFVEDVFIGRGGFTRRRPGAFLVT